MTALTELPPPETRTRIDLPSPEAPAMGRAARNAAVLAAFLRTLNGPLDDGEVIGLDFDALFDTAPPLSVSRSQLVAKPHLVRRLLAPLVLASSDQQEWTSEFRELVRVACSTLTTGRDDDKKVGTGRRPTFDDELRKLRQWGRERFAMARRAASARDVRKGLQLTDPEELLEVDPAYVQTANGVFTVSRRAMVKAPLRAIQEVLNPVNWSTMGDFFEHVERIGKNKDEYRENGSWRGLFAEHFVVGWGPFSTNSYNAVLNVDFTVDDSRVRADYSLAYERDDQLEVDDGYLEASTVPGKHGWCEYYAEKSTKFRSPGSNLLAPAILAVALESHLASIEDAAYDRLEFLKAGEEG